MTNGFANIMLIITLLFSQSSQAFDISQMPCEQEHVMMSNVGQANSLEHHLQMQVMNAGDTGNSCCEQDCNCPSGLLSVAVLLDTSLKSDVNFKTTPPSAILTSLKTVVLQKQQRPPKQLSFS